MRRVLLSLAAAAASVAVASPAFANEARVEARGGAVWSNGDTEATAGIAAGYDFDLGQSTFAGVEVSADKMLTSNTKVAFGFNARAGAKLGETTKLYALGGYTTEPCDACKGSWGAGAGFQQAFGKSLYGKLEYRHDFVGGLPDSNSAVAGVGVRF